MRVRKCSVTKALPKSAVAFAVCAVGLSTTLLSGCNPAPEDAPKHAQQASVDKPESVKQQEDKRLVAFIEARFDRLVAQSPNLQSYLGINNGAQSTWSDTSDALAQKQLENTKADLAKLTAEFDRSDLSDEGKLNFDLFKRELTNEIENAAFRKQSYVVDQFRGQYTSAITLLKNNHRIVNEAGAQAYINRLVGFESLMDDIVARMKDRAAFGVLPPAFSFDSMINDVSAMLTGAPLDAPVTSSSKLHPLYADFKEKLAALHLEESKENALLEEASSALKGPFKRGYSSLLATLKQQKPLQANNDGVWSLPNGDAYYANRVKAETTLALSPEEIHVIGLNEVARIHQQMQQIMDEVEFTGTLQAFFEFIRTDPNNFYANNDEGRAAFLADAKAQTSEIFAVADQYFHTLPKADLEVRRVEPWRENSTSIAFYNRPSLDGSRPGIYYANLADMTGVQKYVFKAITYHEGVPGHHFQIAQAQELEGLPRFRKYLGVGAYIEGWALYAEQLAFEMGFYKNPLHNFGRLQNELWRAVRLVTDTGIHYKRWSREQAIEYFVTNTPLSPQDIETEVERYFVNPGQALSYKMGMLKILELREKAQAKLGNNFDIRDFHSSVLGAGALPLDALEKRVEQYIATKQ